MAVQTPIWTPRGPKVPKMSVVTDFRHEKVSFWDGFWGCFSAHFLFLASGTLKKGCLGGPSKLDPFFSRFWDLPGGPQECSRPHGSSISTFAAGPKKGSKMGANMERFGSPNPNYTAFSLRCWGVGRVSKRGAILEWFQGVTARLPRVGPGGGASETWFLKPQWEDIRRDMENNRISHACCPLQGRRI